MKRDHLLLRNMICCCVIFFSFSINTNIVMIEKNNDDVLEIFEHVLFVINEIISYLHDVSS